MSLFTAAHMTLYCIYLITNDRDLFYDYIQQRRKKKLFETLLPLLTFISLSSILINR